MAEESSSKNQQLFPIILFFGVIAFAYLLFSVYKNLNFRETLNLQDVTSQSEQAEVVDQYIYEASESGQTPFQLLSESEEVISDQFDLGVFVTGINGQESNEEYYWALYINDDYALEAADRIKLEPGDKVEWRWEKIEPNFPSD